MGEVGTKKLEVLNKDAMQTMDDKSVNVAEMVESLLRDNLKDDSEALRIEIQQNPLTKPLSKLKGSITATEIQDNHLSITKSTTEKTTFGKLRSLSKGATDFLFPKDKFDSNKIATVAVIDNIFRNVEIYLNDLPMSSGFQELYASQVIKNVIEGIDVYNMDNEYSFTLLPTLKVKVAVHASRFAIPFFQKMQKMDRNKKTKLLLEQLKLSDYYPSKISLSDVMAVSNLPVESTAALPWRIMQKLIMQDYIGRENEIKIYAQMCKCEITEESATEDEDIYGPNTYHPQDIFLAILSCCDLILKQTLISKMFICRLAVPFLSPGLISESMQLSLWALRSIIIKLKIGDEKFKESSVVKEPLKTIAFIKLGNPSESKSILLNHVMTDQLHHSFWDMECPLSDTKRQLADGLVECQWFIPSSSYKKNESSALNTSDVFKDVTMFMNLRGDACKFKKQVNVMKYFANIIVCLVDISDIEKSDISEFMTELNTGPVKLMWVITNRCPESIDMTKKQLEPYSNVLGGNIVLGFKSKRRRPIAHMKRDIRISVNKILQTENGKVIEDVCLKQKIDGILIDENDELCKSAKMLAQEVISGMDNKSTGDCKNNMLKLQGSILQEWSDLQKKKERSGKQSEESNVSVTIGIQEEMICLRKKQYNYSSPLSKLMTYFLRNLIKTVDTPTVGLFLQWVKLYLDEKSRNTIPGLWDKWSKLSDSGDTSGLLEAEKRLADASLGLEHLLREMSQIYEAAVESNNKLNRETHAMVQTLPIIAAELLIKGQPIEIMDGDTGSVPITWIKAMLKSLKEKIGNKRMYVISVLGIQSSGKSTLMNTMFGLQFVTSAGRCTRGAFMQLIEVKDDSMNYDYVLVVDTEGLRAPELGETKIEHDNELATFVIGIGDVTIINIKGENMVDMSDVLQIAVHAFLRMKLVNQTFELQRSCVFIHQNVDSEGKSKMQQGFHKLQEKLDKLTVEASKMEKITDICSFNQVINFDRNKHVWYFSNLWLGNPPMSPINPGYSENAQDVKHCLLIDIPKNLSVLTLTGMTQRIEDIWSGVLTDDFVFSFRNSLAASVFHSLDIKYNELKWNIESEITEWVQTDAVTQLQGFVSCDSNSLEELSSNFSCDSNSLEELSSNLQTELRTIVQDLKETAKKELTEFFSSHSNKDILKEWENITLRRLDEDSYEFYRNAKRDIMGEDDNLKFDFDQQQKQTECEKEILRNAKDFAESTKGTQVDDQQLLFMFDTVWDQWVAELKVNGHDEPVNIEAIVEKVLWNNLQKDSTSLRKEIGKNPLTKPFDLKVLAGSIGVNEIDLELHLCVSKSILKQAAKKVYNFASNKKNETEENLIAKKAVAVIEDIFESVGIYLNNLSHVSCRFQESHVSQVIKKVIQGIDEHNKNKEQSFTIAPTLKVKLVVHTSRFAITVFKKMQADYDEINSITGKLKKKKNNIFDLFENMVMQRTNELIAADFLYGNIVAGIMKVLDTKLPHEIVKDITMHFRYTKYQLIVEILDDLADKDNFDDYISFIKNAKLFSEKWVINFTNRKFCEATYEAKKKHINMKQRQQIIVHRIIDDLKKGIMSASDAELSKKKENQSMITWSKTFKSCLTEITIQASELKLVSALDVFDFLNFRDLLINKFDGLEKEMLYMYKDVKLENITWSEDTPYNKILEVLWGCSKQCPFCNEQCIEGHTTGNKSHRCVQHRPSGVRGIRWAKGENEGKLGIESCNFDVQSLVKFSCGASQYECRASDNCNTTDNEANHEYRDYKTYLPTWDIEPSSCMGQSNYWNWFIATYKHQLSEHYNAKLPDIPETWNEISKAKAKQSLRIYFTL